MQQQIGSSANTPFSNANTPFYNTNMPFSSANTPFSSANTPFSSANTPFSRKHALLTQTRPSLTQTRPPLLSACRTQPEDWARAALERRSPPCCTQNAVARAAGGEKVLLNISLCDQFIIDSKQCKSLKLNTRLEYKKPV